MGMMFGGWAREEEEKSIEEKENDRGFSKGIKTGKECGISLCQLVVSQSINLNHEQKIKLWDELEKLR